MGRLTSLHVLLALAATGFGCWDQPAEPEGTATFTLVNNSDRTVLIQSRVGFAFAQTLPAISLTGPDGAQVLQAFDGCSMEDCEGDNEPTCGLSGRDQQPVTVAIGPGQSHKETWNGYLWQPRDGEMCHERVGSEALEYRITFCWGFNTSPDVGEGIVALQTCQTHTFTLEGAVEVRQEVTSVPPELEVPGPVILRFRNNRFGPDGSPVPLFVSQGDACRGGSWSELTDSSGALVTRFFQGGSLCNFVGSAVDTSKRGLVPPQDQGGARAPVQPCAPISFPVEPGASLDDFWNGLLWRILEPNGCVKQESGFSKDYNLKVCFGTMQTCDEFGNCGALADETCQSTSFTVGREQTVAEIVVN